MQRQLLLILPALMGGAAMVFTIYQSNFLLGLIALNLVWIAVLLCPFIFVGALAWRSRRGLIPQSMVIFLALLLAASPFGCIVDVFREGFTYLLALSPIYLWIIVAVASLIDIFTRNRS